GREIGDVKIEARIEHRLGEVLAATVNHKGGRPAKNSDTVSEFKGRVPDGVPPRQSSRTQALTRIPWEKIEEKIDAKTATLQRLRVRSSGPQRPHKTPAAGLSCR